jgi:hypothetical protein
LVSLIAHELAHSWSGNLVTNATWDDFWLNEGFTVYFERRIMEALEGKDYAEMLAVLGYQDLIGTIADFGDTSTSTHLKLNLKGSDPDDGMNDVAYEKGYLLLCHLEQIVGRPAWDAFVKKYFDTHAFQSMTTEKFLGFLESELLISNKQSLESTNVKNWIYKPGLPQGLKAPESLRFSKAGNAANLFVSKGETPQNSEAWSSHEWLHFLRTLPDGLSQTQLQKLDQNFSFTKLGNSEILFQWLLISIQNKYLPAYDALEYFLQNTGRRKFVLPLYKELVKTVEGKDLAKRIFQISKGNYHSVTRQSVEALFKNP